MAERKYKNPQVNLRLPQELKDRIAALSELKGRSTNAEMVDAISYWVQREERLQAEIADRKDMERRFHQIINEVEQLKEMLDKKPT